MYLHKLTSILSLLKLILYLAVQKKLETHERVQDVKREPYSVTSRLLLLFVFLSLLHRPSLVNLVYP